MVRHYVGARYVPKLADPVAWASGTNYEAMTIVTYNNSSYTSKMPVPATVGNPADNPDYWALTGNYNAQVEQYRQETKTVSNILQGNINSEASTRAAADSNLQSQINQIIAPSGEAPSAAEVQNARIGANGVTYDTLGDAIRGQVNDLKSALTYKADVAYAETTTNVPVSFTKGKLWVPETGAYNDNTKRASSGQITIRPDMKSISVASGYVMQIFGNDLGAGHAFTLITTYTTNTIQIKNNITYKYIYVVVARSDVSDIMQDDLSNVVNIATYTVIPYATINDLAPAHLNTDYYFVKNGKLICANQPVGSNGNVAKYARVDVGTDVKKVRCKFTQRGGGNVTLIATPLDTDNHVQNIVNKSIHVVFGITQVSVQTFLNGSATTIASYNYTITTDDATSYEIGFEVVDNTTFKVLTPDGVEHTVTHDFTESNGRYFIFETFKSSMNVSDVPSIYWDRPSIMAVYCKPSSGHAFRDDFVNYPDYHQPGVSPSGHVYTLFRNVASTDSTYVNANGTHDA